MEFSRTQQGMSIISTLAVLIVIGFFALMLMKLVPHYLDNKALDKIITSVGSEQSTAGSVRTVNDFYTHISKGMQINNISGLKPAEIVKITQSGNEFVVQMKYEQREPLLGNIDLVVKFDKEYRVRPR